MSSTEDRDIVAGAVLKMLEVHIEAFQATNDLKQACEILTDAMVHWQEWMQASDEQQSPSLLPSTVDGEPEPAGPLSESLALAPPVVTSPLASGTPTARRQAAPGGLTLDEEAVEVSVDDLDARQTVSAV
jgi:hypothetical protein